MASYPRLYHARLYLYLKVKRAVLPMAIKSPSRAVHFSGAYTRHIAEAYI
jgi:hypothetical protein